MNLIELSECFYSYSKNTDSMYTQIIIKKNYFFSLQYIRMSGKNINFNDTKIRKSTFYKNKTINNIEDINVNNILVSKKEPHGNKNSFKSVFTKLDFLKIQKMFFFSNIFTKN